MLHRGDENRARTIAGLADEAHTPAVLSGKCEGAAPVFGRPAAAQRFSGLCEMTVAWVKSSQLIIRIGSFANCGLACQVSLFREGETVCLTEVPYSICSRI